MAKKPSEFHPPARKANNPDLLSFSVSQPEYVRIKCNFAVSTVIIKGISGSYYSFNNGQILSVLATDAPELLKRTRTYRPCCSGKEKELPVFSLIE